MVFDTLLNTLIFSEKGNVGVNISAVNFEPLTGTGSITLPANLPINQKLIIKLSMEEAKQESQFREQSDYKLRNIESALDAVILNVQRLFEKSKRSFGFDDKASYTVGLNTQIPLLPIPNGIPIMDNTGTNMTMIDSATLIAASGAGVPAGGLDEQVLGNTAGTAVWKDYAYSGFSARFGSLFNSTSLNDTLTKILNITYAPPTISLSGTGATLREKGTVVPSVTLTANYNDVSNPIVAPLTMQRNGLDIYTNAAVIATGGSDALVYSTPFSDTTSFTAKVGDGTTLVTSNTVTYPFVYPYYYGAGVAALTNVGIAALIKQIITQTNTAPRNFTAANGNKLYFSYPTAYPALTSILDVSNFETITDWTARTVIITGLDATAQSYRVYEFNNPVIAGSYDYTFKI
jgi:hypothetical protein